MKSLLPLAEKIAARLIERREKIAVADHHRRPDRGGSARGARRVGLLPRRRGGLYEVIATGVLGIGDAEMQGLRPSTEAYSLLIARRVRERHGATWGLGETGATGPTGNHYGDLPATPASPSLDRWNARLRWKPAAPTAWRIGCFCQTRA